MLQVNLLSWRAACRDKRYRFWRTLLLAGVAAEIALMLLFGWQNQRRQSHAESFHAYLSHHHAALQAQLEKVNTLKNALQQAERVSLQSQQRLERSLHYAQLLQHLSKNIPQGIWLTQLHQNGGQFRLEGQSEGYSDILALNQALRREDLLPLVQLREVKQLPASSLFFSFNAALAASSKE